MNTRFPLNAARRPLHTLAAVSLAALLAACGGGGGADDTAASPSPAPANGPSAAARAAVLAAGPALAPAPAGLAGNVTCRNQTIGAVSLDTVTVAADSACRLDGTVLAGSVIVQRGASLEALGVDVNGNLQAEGAAHVEVGGGARFGGSVQVKQGGSASIADAAIEGDLQIDAMAGAVSAAGNAIGGNLQVVSNRGGTLLERNRIDGNLQCFENSPVPVYAENSAAGYDGQCAAGTGGGATGGGSGGGVQPAGPLAGNVTCDGLIIGAEDLDTVTVPDGAVCVLEGTRLVGSVLVGRGAVLLASDVEVNGNLQGDGVAEVLVAGASRFGGSVQVKEGGGLSVAGARITGDLQVEKMAGPVVASGNAIGGNLQANENRGGVSLTANRMAGNLQCQANQPAPGGGGNVAQAREDQCEAL
jgi:hypothetical protein